MKHRLWMLNLPLVLLFTAALYVSEAGIRGELESATLRDEVFPRLRTVTGWFTNVKFQLRGPNPPADAARPQIRSKNKIVIVDVDNESINAFGRWPWHRDVISMLIRNSFIAGAKVVGLDVVFSEADQRVSDETRLILAGKGVPDQEILALETDPELTRTIAAHADRLVLGYAFASKCQPAYGTLEDCPVTLPEVIATYPQGIEKFGFGNIRKHPSFDVMRSPLESGFEVLANLPEFNRPARHAGYFDALVDRDSFIRRANLVTLINGRPFPSLALAMAGRALDEPLEIELSSRNLVGGIRFSKSGRKVQVTPHGVMEVNFRGPSHSFEYVSAYHLLADPEEAISRVIASDGAPSAYARRTSDAFAEARAKLKDSLVLIGVSALGTYDMRAFPFDENTPGVEGHANILDNLLSGDMLVYGSDRNSSIILFCLMTLGALLFAYATERLESIPALLLFATVVLGLGFVDVKLLFARNQNYNTVFFAFEIGAVFMLTLAAKYVAEERNKKFIRGAFAKYVSPTIVDAIIKDPTKLSVGGEKRDLTILFSDIRGFTSFSEKMDAKALAAFLNDYLGIMTDIVFECEGTLDKYIGDAVMAFWGAPLDQRNHAYNACRAAIRMQQKLAEHYERFKTQYDVEVAIGIGVNSGPVNVGNMGSERIFEYTVIGDHVNLASRLEGLTKYYGVKIVTTRFTFDGIRDAGGETPPHRVLDFVKVKGKKSAVELIQVLERDYSPEGLEIFDEARKLYRLRQFTNAIEKFREASSILRGVNEEYDGPSRMYEERCREFNLNPPDADWDGSWEMTSK